MNLRTVLLAESSFDSGKEKNLFEGIVKVGKVNTSKRGGKKCCI